MKTLKHLALVALVCCGASVMAMQSVRNQVDAESSDHLPKLILSLSDGQMYHLFNLGTKHPSDKLPALLNHSEHMDEMDKNIYQQWSDINKYMNTLSSKLMQKFSEINKMAIPDSKKASLKNECREANEKIRQFVMDRSLSKANRYATKNHLPERG